jgi:hypothetical protein
MNLFENTNIRVSDKDILVPSCCLMVLSIVIIDCFLLRYNFNYPIHFSLFSLLYLIGYLYPVILGRTQLSLRNIIFLFVLIKVYALFFLISSGHIYDFNPSGRSDWESFHLPYALKIDSVLEHLFSTKTTYNGRLTHTVLYFLINLLSILGVDSQSYSNIFIVSYIFNIVLSLITFLIVYRLAIRYSSNINFSRRATWFLAFNPFFLLYTGLPLKEPILFFALSLFLLFLVSHRKSYTVLLISLLIISFERVYIIPLLILILFVMEKNKLLKILAAIIGVLIVESFIGIDRALSMHSTHVKSLTSIDGSFLPNHGFFWNIIRTMFGPAFFRPFLGDDSGGGAILLSKYLMYIFYAFMSIKSLICTKGVEKIILLTYIFVLILLPFHGTFKMLMLTSFGVIFLDNMSRVKYINKEALRI